MGKIFLCLLLGLQTFLLVKQANAAPIFDLMRRNPPSMWSNSKSPDSEAYLEWLLGNGNGSVNNLLEYDGKEHRNKDKNRIKTRATLNNLGLPLRDLMTVLKHVPQRGRAEVPALEEDYDVLRSMFIAKIN